MILDIIKSIEIFKSTKKINHNKLPSQGYFYKDDFWIKIKKADIEDQIYYNFKYKGDNALILIEIIKEIVKRNTFYSKGYSFNDVRSIDVIYIFFKIVEYTMGRCVTLKNVNSINGEIDFIPVCDDTFLYYEVNHDRYKLVNNQFVSKSGFKFKIPSIKVEDSLSKFITIQYYLNKPEYMDYSYDFVYFIGDKNDITDNEILSMLDIFNSMDNDNKSEVLSIIDEFKGMAKYSITHNNIEYCLDGRLDLENVFNI